MSKRATRQTIPTHPEGFKFCAGADGFHLWHAGPMQYQITKAGSFDVVGTITSLGYFLPRVKSLKASLESMTEAQAKKEGAKAQQAGKPNAPALNQAFLMAACASPIQTMLLLDAYLRGWTVAMLAAETTDPETPSARELAAIQAA